MTDNTQPLALRLAEQYDYGDPVAHSNTWKVAVCNELRRQHARIAELESQLESIGAGGVSGPMMGQPQAMPDLSALTERGAKAWAGVDAQGLREGFTAADMATASAQGFRDGVASVAASAGSEPVATVFTMEALAPGGGVKYHATVHKPLPAGTKLYLHPSPPEEMVGGWRPIEAAPKDGTRFVAVGQNYGLYSETQHICIAQWFRGCWIEVSDWNGASKLKYLTHWMPLPPLPGSAARKQGDE